MRRIAPLTSYEKRVIQAIMHWFEPLPPPVSRSTGTSSRSEVESVEKTLMKVEKASIWELRGG